MKDKCLDDVCHCHTFVVGRSVLIRKNSQIPFLFIYVAGETM